MWRIGWGLKKKISFPYRYPIVSTPLLKRLKFYSNMLKCDFLSLSSLSINETFQWEVFHLYLILRQLSLVQIFLTVYFHFLSFLSGLFLYHFCQFVLFLCFTLQLALCFGFGFLSTFFLIVWFRSWVLLSGCSLAIWFIWFCFCFFCVCARFLVPVSVWLYFLPVWGVASLFFFF